MRNNLQGAHGEAHFLSHPASGLPMLRVARKKGGGLGKDRGGLLKHREKLLPGAPGIHYMRTSGHLRGEAVPAEPAVTGTGESVLVKGVLAWLLKSLLTMMKAGPSYYFLLLRLRTFYACFSAAPFAAPGVPAQICAG